MAFLFSKWWLRSPHGKLPYLLALAQRCHGLPTSIALADSNVYWIGADFAVV